MIADPRTYSTQFAASTPSGSLPPDAHSILHNHFDFRPASAASVPLSWIDLEQSGLDFFFFLQRFFRCQTAPDPSGLFVFPALRRPSCKSLVLCKVFARSSFPLPPSSLADSSRGFDKSSSASGLGTRVEYHRQPQLPKLFIQGLGWSLSFFFLPRRGSSHSFLVSARLIRPRIVQAHCHASQRLLRVHIPL